MKKTDPEFLALQKEWYDKLKECGFKDIEVLRDGCWQLRETHAHIISRNINTINNPVLRDAKIDYFHVISGWVNDPDTIFRSKADRMIMEMYANGIKKKDIFSSLKEAGFPKSLAAIRFIIRRYEEKWGITTYTMEQLNRKRKPTP